MKTNRIKNNYKNNKINFSGKKRLEIVEKNFITKLNLKFNKKKFPIISVCSSGGGFRSMLATLGALEGLQNLNLLDSIFNISSLSGSSWGVISWILSGKNIIEFNRNFSKKLNDFYSLKRVSKINFNKLKSYKNFLKSFYYLVLKQKEFKQKNNLEFGFVDLYGIFISLIILDNFYTDILDINLQNFNNEKGLYPQAIFTATAQLNNYKYEWFEFTSSYFGSKNIKYLLDSKDSQINIITLLGLLGSSFSGSFKDVLNRILQLPLPKDFIEILEKAKNRIETASWGSKRIGASYLNNVNYKNSTIKNLKKFPVFDGGYISNIPLEVLLNQDIKSDIIFIIDNAGILPPTSVLRDTEKQLIKKGYKIPKIDYNLAKKESLSIFKEKNLPTIVYIPLKRNVSYSKTFDPYLEKFCGTTNFFYSRNQAEMLMGLTRHVILSNKEKILNLF